MGAIYKSIEQAAKEGYLAVNHEISGLDVRKVEETIKQLHADGYTVKRDSGCDRWDSWDHLVISWDKTASAEDYYSK